MNIRKYQSHDKSDLLKLIIYLQNFEQHLEPKIQDSGENIAGNFLSNLLKKTQNEKGIIYVAEQNTVIGFITGHIEHGKDKIEFLNKKIFYISNLAVLPDFQKQGIGKALLTKIEAYAKSLGLKLIQINVLNKNKIAYEAYKKMKYRDYEIGLIKETSK